MLTKFDLSPGFLTNFGLKQNLQQGLHQAKISLTTILTDIHRKCENTHLLINPVLKFAISNECSASH